MTDLELAAFLGIAGRADIVAKLDPVKRATYERLADVSMELNLHAAGLAPKPKDVIVCYPRCGARKFNEGE